MIINLSREYEILTPSDEQLVAIKIRVFERLRLEVGRFVPAPSGYVIGGDGNSGDLCIDTDGKIWVVYCCERGIRYNCAFFPGSISAANFFLGELVRSHPGLAKIQPFLIQEIN